MTFSEFCAMAENTELEQQLFEQLKTDKDMSELKEVLSKLKHIPVVGKTLEALAMLGDYESIADFKQTEYYPHIMNWNFAFEPDKKSISLNPSKDMLKDMRKKAIPVLGVIAAVIVLLVLLKKCCNRRK